MGAPNSNEEVVRDTYLILDGFERMKAKIHLHSNGISHRERLSTETILPAIRHIAYSIGPLDAYCALETILANCSMTRSARSEFEQYVPDDPSKVTVDVYSSIPTGRMWPLVEMIKCHNSDFYNTVYRFKFKSIQMFRIDLSEPFSLKEFKSDVEGTKYKEENAILGGLSRLLRYDDRKGGVFLVKEPDATIDGYQLSYLKPKTVKRMLDEIEMAVTRNDQCMNVTAWTLLFSHLSQFTVRGSRFYSDSDAVVSYYYGFHYQPVVNNSVNVFMDYLDKVCESDMKEVLLDWIAFLVQKPSEPLSVVLRIGSKSKELISKVLLRLLTGYSVSNDELLFESDHFTPLIENRRLIVLNSRYPNFEYLSHILPKRRPILVSSDTYPSHPVIVDSALLIVSDKASSSKSSICINCTDIIDGCQLKKEMENDALYEGLMDILLKRDISKFNSKSKRTIKAFDVYDRTIQANYSSLTSKKGVQLTDFKRSLSEIAPGSDWNTMKKRIEETCDMIRRSVDGVQRNRYYLKKEHLNEYRP